MQIKDYLYNEADNSCTLCGIKDKRNLTIHHLDHDDNNNKYDNQIILCHNCHNRHHTKKGISKKLIKETKRGLIIKTLTIYGVNAIKYASRESFGITAMPFLLYHLVDLGFMKQKENQMGYGEQEDVTARFIITKEGKRLYHKWFKS